MTPLEKLDYYLNVAYAQEPPDGLSDLSSTSRPEADMTFGDLTEVLALASREALDTDLRGRLERAVTRLAENRDARHHSSTEHARLSGKIEGVKLALSYMSEPTR